MVKGQLRRGRRGESVGGRPLRRILEEGPQEELEGGREGRE